MIVEIKLKNGESFYTDNTDIANVKVAIDGEFPIDCWWFAPNGQRFEETHIFLDEELIIFIRTDSDALDRRRI